MGAAAAGHRRGAVRRAAGRLPALVGGTYLGSLLLLTIPPLWLLVRLAPTGLAADRAVRLWCRLILALSGCSLRLEGEDHLTTVTGPVVLAANHASYLDVVILLAALPLPFRLVAKHELARAPLIGLVIRKVGHLTVERGRATRSVADTGHITRRYRPASRCWSSPRAPSCGHRGSCRSAWVASRRRWTPAARWFR